MRRRTKRHYQSQNGGEQPDLFRSPDIEGGQRPPAWETLPLQTRQQLTGLMTRLMLDHKADRQDRRTKDARHES